MGKIKAAAEVTNLKTEDERARYVQIFLQEVLEQVNGGLEFTENIKAKILDLKFTSANTDLAITHGLGKIPIGYWIVGKSSASVNLYDGINEWTKNLIYLRSGATGTAKVIVF